MQIIYLNPKELLPNSWNPNQVDPINLEKLAASLDIDGIQKAVQVRTLETGERQILDGFHRVKAANLLGWKEIPCVDLGDITDGAAKKIGLIGNSRYGDDDPLLMANLLRDTDIGTAEELLSTLPLDEESITAYFEHDIEFDLDGLDDLDGTTDLGIEAEIKDSTPTKTHQIMRFKVSIEDAVSVTDLVKRTQHAQGFTEDDDLTNAGDALIFLIKEILTRE